jgi:hypothetical protein
MDFLLKRINMQAFQSLNKIEKIDFFIKCQDLLIKHHPKSEFLFTKDNFQERMSFVKNFYDKYQGFVYTDDKICVLFNQIRVEDEKNPIQAIKNFAYKAPAPNYNAYSIDFVVFRELVDCIDFCKIHYNPQIQYVLFVRSSEVKLYRTDKLLNKLNDGIFAAVNA